MDAADFRRYALDAIGLDPRKGGAALDRAAAGVLPDGFDPVVLAHMDAAACLDEVVDAAGSRGAALAAVAEGAGIDASEAEEAISRALLPASAVVVCADESQVGDTLADLYGIEPSGWERVLPDGGAAYRVEGIDWGDPPSAALLRSLGREAAVSVANAAFNGEISMKDDKWEELDEVAPILAAIGLGALGGAASWATEKTLDTVTDDDEEEAEVDEAVNEGIGSAIGKVARKVANSEAARKVGRELADAATREVIDLGVDAIKAAGRKVRDRFAAKRDPKGGAALTERCRLRHDRRMRLLGESRRRADAQARRNLLRESARFAGRRRP